MKLAANLSLLYPGLPLPEKAAAAARDGFAGVELLDPYTVGDADLHALLLKHGLTLALINTPMGAPGEKGLACLPGREREFMAGVSRALHACTATGCRIVHAMAGTLPKDGSQNACRETLLANLRQAAPMAAEAGVTLTLEALNRHDAPGYFYHLPTEAAEIVAAVDHPAVRLQFDFYHAQREQLEVDRALQQVLAWVHHVQFAHPEQRQEPDPSDPPVAAALRTLRRAGYTGWVGCEYRPKGDTTAGLGWRDAYQAVITDAV
ncbi:TIM barrel protein [Alcaligenaceae bacterium]|nr:TIM barrel protein [Alcaligenaceae bacterium]